jgi:hypothetical protein
MSYLSLIPRRAHAGPHRARFIAPLTSALVLLASACGETPTAPHSAPASPNQAISSGAIGVSPRQFFFLLRDLQPTAFQGTFDATLSPQVSVCLWVNDACQSTVLAPVTLGTRGAASLTVNSDRQRYIFQWRTRGASLQPNAVYRLMVRVNGMQMGYLDIATGQKQRELRQINRREFLPLRVGGTVKVAFRIEEGPPIPSGIPGRYESSPDVCSTGCLVHATPWAYYLMMWGGVRLGDLGGYGEASVIASFAYDDPNPVLPPVPAPGSVSIPATGSWSWRYNEQGDVEIWVDGMESWYWFASGGGAVLHSMGGPFYMLNGLGKLPGYFPTP